jgi:hypothetical protein
MLGVRSATGCLPPRRSPLTGVAFQQAPGQSKAHVPRTSIPPEPETRNGLSLARNDAFATITRSMLPTCAFASPPETSGKSVRSKAPSLGPVSKPVPGEILAADPLSAPISAALATRSDLHSPSGSYEPSGSKRSTGYITRSSPGLTFVVYRSPPRSLTIARRINVQKLRYRPARLSFRKPWN